MKKIIILCSLCILSFLLVSCEMFTTSLWGRRDLSKSLEGSSVEDIVGFLTSGQALSSEDSKEISNILAQKPAEELIQLSNDEKASVINIAAGGALPSPADLAEMVDAETILDVDIDQLLPKIARRINTDVDTGAIEKLFTDDATVEALLLENPDALLLGTLALTAKLMNESDFVNTSHGESKILKTIFTDTFVALDNAYADGTISPEDESAALAVLSRDLKSDSKIAETLLNVAVVLYTVTEEKGFDSLGALAGVFDDLIGSDVSTFMGI